MDEKRVEVSRVVQAPPDRVFALVSDRTNLDGDEVEIDLADEAQREMLIVAEHPQYRRVRDDPFPDELVDGVNPRLHAVRHRIIADQLWDDTPPEVWLAAERLLAAGHDRPELTAGTTGLTVGTLLACTATICG